MFACLIFYSLICSLLYGVSFNLCKIKLTLVVRRFVFIRANSELLEHRNRVKNMRDTRMRMQCGQLLGQMHGCLLSWLQYGSIVEDYPPPRSLSFSLSLSLLPLLINLYLPYLGRNFLPVVFTILADRSRLNLLRAADVVD